MNIIQKPYPSSSPSLSRKKPLLNGYSGSTPGHRAECVRTNNLISTKKANTTTTISSSNWFYNESKKERYEDDTFGLFKLSKSNKPMEQCKNNVHCGELIAAPSELQEYVGRTVVIKWKYGARNTVAKFKEEIQREIKAKQALEDNGRTSLLFAWGVIKGTGDKKWYQYYMISEHKGMNGQDLLDLFKANGLPNTEQIARIFAIEMIDFLLFMVSMGLNHHDFKIKNILVPVYDERYKAEKDEDEFYYDEIHGHPHLLLKRIIFIDFGEMMDGIELKNRRTISLITLTDPPAMSPDWSPPEYVPINQFEIVKHGHRSDIWTMGANIYNMIKGRPPWTESERKQIGVSIFMKESGNVRFKDYKVPDPTIPTHFVDDGSLVSQNMKDFVAKCLPWKHCDRSSLRTLVKHPWITDGLLDDDEKENLMDDDDNDINEDSWCAATIKDLINRFNCLKLTNKSKTKNTKKRWFNKKKRRRHGAKQKINKTGISNLSNDWSDNAHCDVNGNVRRNKKQRIK